MEGGEGDVEKGGLTEEEDLNKGNFTLPPHPPFRVENGQKEWHLSDHASICLQVQKNYVGYLFM